MCEKRIGFIMQIAVAFLVCTAPLTLTAIAQPTGEPSQVLGVKEAIAIAHQQHPELNTLREQIAKKGGERKSSFGLYAPTVSYAREGIGNGLFMEQRFVFSQSVDFPLSSYYKIKQIGTQRDALELQLASETRRVTANVKKAYTVLLYTQELVHLRVQEVQLANDLIEGARVRVQVGEASELELIKAELQYAEATSSHEEATLQLQLARYDLFKSIGIDPDQQVYSIQFPDTLAYIDVQIEQERAMAYIDQLPAMKSAAKNMDAARLGIKSVRASLFPAFQIDYFPQDFGAGYNRHGFQFGLRLPLWLNNYQGNIQVARAHVQSVSWHNQSIYIEIKKNVEQAWHGYESSKRTIDRYEQEIKSRAAELLARTQEGYRIGEIDLLTLLNTQQTYLRSEQQYYTALRNYYFYLIELEQYTGEDIVYTNSVD